MIKYKAGDKVELNCSKEEFRENVEEGYQIICENFDNNGVANISRVLANGDIRLSEFIKGSGTAIISVRNIWTIKSVKTSSKKHKLNLYEKRGVKIKNQAIEIKRLQVKVKHLANNQIKRNASEFVFSKAKIEKKEFDTGMCNAMKAIAKSCGKSFGVNIGCKLLPRVVDDMVNKKGNSEWKNGDECVYSGNENCFIVGDLPSSPMIVIECADMSVIPVMLSDISKPETQQQKAAREREEMAKALCEIRCESFNLLFMWDALCEDKRAGYYKMVDAGVTIK